jgi:hypothetical protein
LENPGVDGKIILRWIFKKWDKVTWTAYIWLNPYPANVENMVSS